MMAPKLACTSLGSALLLLFTSYPTFVISSNVNMEDAPHGRCPGGLKCHHGGECATGDKDHSLDHPIISADLPWLEELNVNGEHCINCHDGWGGVDCSRKYQVCDPSDPDAPTCFNGSQCYKMGISAVSGKYEYMCDCTMAGQEEGGDPTKKYAGKFCQHLQEIKCGDSDDDEMFCTNGGKCVNVFDEKDWSHKHFSCQCPDHRAGTHCEFLKEDGFTDCRLECNHGQCAKGFKSYDNLIGTGPFPAKLAFDIISSNGEHCVCPDGWTGLKCEIPVKRCGPTKYCYNGSTCMYDENGNPMCDCNAAHTDDVSYAGMSCEQEGTTYCDPNFDQDRKDSFCANHGQCIDDKDTRHMGCICEDGWSGDLCDIQGNDEPVCDLDCHNGGSCRFGVKGYKDSLDELFLPALAKKHVNGMHCSCPEGFTGVKCEVDVNHCHLDDGSKSGGEADFCLNGVPCNPEDPNMDGMDKKFSCQCDKDGDEISQMLTGRFCEYAVTEYCSKDRARHSHSFCTNGGKCKKYGDHDSEHHGCCCPAGYEGDYCQLPKGTLDLENTPVTWSSMNECNHKKSSPHKDVSAQTVFPVAPKPNGEWEHISINPKFEVPTNDTEEEEESPTLQAASPEADTQEKSNNTGGIVSGVLVSLLVAGIAGVVYRKRNMKEDPHQFDADWWKGHTGDWWKGDGSESPQESVWGDGSLEAGTNINSFRASPTKTSRKTFGQEGSSDLAPQREWSYPEGHTLSNDALDKKLPWEYSNDHGDLHEVVI